MYFGWYIVVIAAVVYMLTAGMIFSAFGLFVIPVSEEMNLSRANMNSALIILNVGIAALSPFIGRLLDRIPARRAMITCALLLGLSLAILGLSRSLWLSALIFCLTLPAAIIGGGTLTMSVLLARWFVVQRGRAMMLAAMGLSLGGLLIAPVVAVLIESLGWRSALLAMAGGATAILLISAMLVRERPRADESEGGDRGGFRRPDRGERHANEAEGDCPNAGVLDHRGGRCARAWGLAGACHHNGAARAG